MSRLRISAPSLSNVIALWLVLLLGQVLEHAIDGEPLDLATLVGEWAVAGAVTVLPYGLLRLAITRRGRP